MSSPLPFPPSGKLRVHWALSKQPALVHWGCCNKKYPRRGVLQTAKTSSSQLWRPEVQGQGASASASLFQRAATSGFTGGAFRPHPEVIAGVTELSGTSFIRALVPLVPCPPQPPDTPHTLHPVRLCPLGLINHRSQAPLGDFRQWIGGHIQSTPPPKCHLLREVFSPLGGKTPPVPHVCRALSTPFSLLSIIFSSLETARGRDSILRSPGDPYRYTESGLDCLRKPPLVTIIKKIPTSICLLTVDAPPGHFLNEPIKAAAKNA